MAPSISRRWASNGERIGSSSSRFWRLRPFETCRRPVSPSSISPTTCICSHRRRSPTRNTLRSPRRSYAASYCTRPARGGSSRSDRSMRLRRAHGSRPQSSITARAGSSSASIARGTQCVEAAILATRLHLIPRNEIDAELARLQTVVDKTAGPRESEAMALLTSYVRSAAGRPA